MRQLPAAAAACALYVAVAVLAPVGRDPAALLRNLGRPLILPFLWSSLEQARRTGTPGEFIERGRLLLRLLPRWVDGHVYLADELAFGRSRAGRNDEHALDRLGAAMLFLEQAQRRCQEKADEILIAMAFLVEFRAARDPELARAFRRRYGQDPRQAADGYLARAERIHPATSLRDRRAFLAERMVVPALRRGDRDEALRRIARAIALLDTARDRATAAMHSRALQRLERYLRHADPGLTIDELARDPYLEELAAALRAGTKEGR